MVLEANDGADLDCRSTAREGDRAAAWDKKKQLNAKGGEGGVGQQIPLQRAWFARTGVCFVFV